MIKWSITCLWIVYLIDCVLLWLEGGSNSRPHQRLFTSAWTTPNLWRFLFVGQLQAKLQTLQFSQPCDLLLFHPEVTLFRGTSQLGGKPTARCALTSAQPHRCDLWPHPYPVSIILPVTSSCCDATQRNKTYSDVLGGKQSLSDL